MFICQQQIDRSIHTYIHTTR